MELNQYLYYKRKGKTMWTDVKHETIQHIVIRKRKSRVQNSVLSVLSFCEFSVFCLSERSEQGTVGNLSM